MCEYAVEFTYKRSNEKGFVFSVKANNFEDAAIKVIEEFKVRGIIIEEGMGGKIKNPKGKYYEIFRDGWLVDSKTGKKISDLEEKLNQKK